ncbi:MAG TPA: bifunctional acetate--CoA ligase family protein/GNAT family N-acetyltransferase [Burkholderiaceae bacterium]|nr:bifunctional acetate--CoA ligase family protein/GNAT family N-acetyltransferase [Burkholderiaceae bacterium]
MSIRNLDALLAPTSIAVIGASMRAGSVGTTVWRNLRAGTFTGPLYAVNPKYQEIDGAIAYARVADLPKAPDLAVLCTPAATIPKLVSELAERGTRAAIVMSAGITGPLKQAMLDAARPHLLRLLGPNCIGLLVPRLGLNASFAHADALAGNLAFVTQSGALLTAVLDWTKSRGIGFSHMVSLGDRADVDAGDLLDWLASDVNTRAILLYLESIESARKFMSAARGAARNKPVIVVKAGRAGGGVRAAASHTGALAGSDIVVDAAIRRAGMLRVDTLAELFTAAATLARFDAAHANDLVVMTNGGGAGVLAADAAERYQVPLAPLDDALIARLDKVLPATWSRANPIDIIGDAPVERYTATLRALLNDPRGPAVLFMHAPTAIVPSAEIARACAPLLRERPGRTLTCWLGDTALAAARRTFEDVGAADYATPEDAVHALAMLRTYRRNQALLLEAPNATSGEPDRDAASALIDRAIAAQRTWLSATEVTALLQAYGIPAPALRVVAPEPEAAIAAAHAIGYPVVLKIVSPEIQHKSDVGGVVIGLRDADELAAAATAMLARARSLRPDARIEGLLVQTMVKRPYARELIVGTSIDEVFGPVVLFGQGGTSVEVVSDRAVALPPLNVPLARDLVSRTRVAKLLDGWRDHPPVAIDAVHGVLVAISQMLADLPALMELDINPLLADANGVIALDARVRVSPEPHAGAKHFAIRPYPNELEEVVRWQDREIVVRPIRPEDHAMHRALVARIAPEDWRLRFFQPRRELSASEFARLTQIDYDREMAFIAVAKAPDGSNEILGVSRAIADPDNRNAEFAILVRSDLQRRGLGRLLLDKLIHYCQARGVERLVGEVLHDNLGMFALAKSEGFAFDPRQADHQTRRIVLPLSSSAQTSRRRGAERAA